MRISINRKDIKRIAAGKPKSEGGEFTELEIELAKYNERLFVAFGKTSDERHDLKSEADNVIAELESRVKKLEAEIENIAVDNVDAHMEIIRLKEELRRSKCADEMPEEWKARRIKEAE